MAPLPGVGSRIAGYVIEGVIGEGGMGVVYRARHQVLEREAALKVLLEALANDPAFRARFHRESKLAARLGRHPNVLPIYDAGESEGLLYLAMYLVDGASLAHVIASEGSLDPARTVAILRQVASALDAAHAQRLIHRDVKPSNVLLERGLDGADRCFLGDFGLVKDTGSTTRLTSSRVVMGTVPYMAPEQLDPRLLKGALLDHRVDVYALGCVLYECLTGHPPFADAETDMAVAVAHLSRPPPKATDDRPDLPSAIDAVIARGMAKDREDRFGRCSDLVEEASRTLAEPRSRVVPIALPSEAVVAPAAPPRAAPSAEPPKIPRVPPPRRPRGRRLLLPAALAFALLAGVVAVLVVRGGEERPEAVWVVGGSTLTRLDPGTRDIVEEVAVGTDAVAVAVDPSGVWVANRGDNTVSRIDPATNRVVETIDVGGDPGGIASDGSSVWVSLREEGVVARIDPSTNEVTDRVSVGSHPQGVAADGAAVWVANFEDGTVSRIDPATLEEVTRIEVGDNPHTVTLGLGFVWVPELTGSAVAQIDPATNRLQDHVGVGSGPIEVAIAGSFLWVLHDDDNRLYQVDPVTTEIVQAIDGLGEPTDVAFGAGLLWVTDSRSHEVIALDLDGRKDGDAVGLSESPSAVTVG